MIDFAFGIFAIIVAAVLIGMLVKSLLGIVIEPPSIRPVGKSGNVIELEKEAQSGCSPKVSNDRPAEYNGLPTEREQAVWKSIGKG